MNRYRTATHWGVYEVDVMDDQIVDVHSIGEDPVPSAAGQALKEAASHSSRIDQPYVRKGWLDDPDGRNKRLRGCDEFVSVSWENAFELAAKELDRVRTNLGNTSIFGGSYGWASAGRFHHAQSQLHRFLNLIGGCTRARDTYSTAAANVILPHVVASWQEMELAQTSWSEIAECTELFVAFGGIPLRNTQMAYGGITEHQSKSGLERASANGVKFINLSPQKKDMPEKVNGEWISLRPGTDTAVMLGIAHVLEKEGLVDGEFLASHTVGYDRFRRYLLGEEDGIAKDATWASEISSLPASMITSLARKMATKRTFISLAWSLQRADHGEQPYWMAVTLACMLGTVGRPGGGFGFGYGAEGYIGSDWRRFNWATFPKSYNPTRFAIPVSRIADALLNPGQVIQYDGQEITYPNIDLVYWAGGNPFHHHQDLNRLVEAWRRPSTVIVNEPWWTPVAQWADIVFPATTALEREDFCMSSHDPYAHVMDKALPVFGQARSDHEIFLGLSRCLGLESEFTEGKSETQWMKEMWLRSQERAAKEGFEIPDYEEFLERKWIRLPDQEFPCWLKGFRDNPEENKLNTPSGKIEIFSEAIASFKYEDCPGHPCWIEPFEWLGSKNSKYGLHLLTPQPSGKLHSQLDQTEFLQKDKVDGKEIILVHPEAAKARGLADGDTVRVYNDRGSCLASVCFEEGILSEVVILPTGSWFSQFGQETIEQNGNPNVLTRDKGTSSLAQGPSANTCLVELEKVH